MPIKETFRKRKKLCVGLIIVVFILVILIAASSQQASKPSGSASTTSGTPQTLVTKSPLEMLPTRDDLSTEWMMPSGSGQSLNTMPNGNATGFVSGATTQLLNTKATSGGMVLAYIYEFNSVESANGYYQTVVNQYKQAGGYTQLSTSGVEATCYAGEGVTGAAIYCVKNNVAFFLTVYSDSADSGIEVAKIISSKIS